MAVKKITQADEWQMTQFIKVCCLSFMALLGHTYVLCSGLVSLLALCPVLCALCLLACLLNLTSIHATRLSSNLVLMYPHDE